MITSTQQIDMMNSQLVATQQQLQSLQNSYNELRVHHGMLLQEVIGLQKTVVNHEHVMQNVMSFLQSVDQQRRRDSRLVTPFIQASASNQDTAATTVVDANQPRIPPPEDDGPASPLQNAAKLLSETNADVLLNPRHLQEMNEASLRMNGTLTTPPPDLMAARNGGPRPPSRSAPNSASSAASVRNVDLEALVYPVGQNIGIDPMYSEHINNIPYTMPVKPPDPAEPRSQEQRKQSTTTDPGWVRQPQILLVEDDPTCRRIGGKFLYAFNCSIDSAVSLFLDPTCSRQTNIPSSTALKLSTR
jgi:osomolarity two-component system, response regulator SKN7